MQVMFDFETMGTRPDTIVLSLGAAIFTKEGIVASTCWYMNRHEQERDGRTINPKTLAWWQKQNGAAQKVFNRANEDALSLDEFLDQLVDWLDEQGKPFKETAAATVPWGNGADFDLAILVNIFEEAGFDHDFKPPWGFWNHRCFRTLNALTNIKKKYQHKGVLHDAEDDAIYQAECARRVLWPEVWKAKK